MSDRLPEQLRWPDDLWIDGEIDPTAATNGHHAPEPSPLDPVVEVRISNRRRKTASAHWEGERIVVLMPSHVRSGEREELVAWLVDRLLTKRPQAKESDLMLAARAEELANRYVPGARPTSVRWVTNQTKRWASCSASTGEIRVSHRLRLVPEWVLDATIVHELAHLVHPNHSAEFHRLAERHPRQREASIFLEGFQLGLQAAGPVDDHRR